MHWVDIFQATPILHADISSGGDRSNNIRSGLFFFISAVGPFVRPLSYHLTNYQALQFRLWDEAKMDWTLANPRFIADNEGVIKSNLFWDFYAVGKTADRVLYPRPFFWSSNTRFFNHIHHQKVSACHQKGLLSRIFFFFKKDFFKMSR